MNNKLHALFWIILLAVQGYPALAADNPDAAEIQRLKAEIETLQQRSREQQRVIETISERLDEIGAAEQQTPQNLQNPDDHQMVESRPGLPADRLQQIAGKGAPEGASTADSTEPVVKEAQPSQSVKDIVREEHVLFSRNLTIEPGLTYSYSDRRQLELTGFLALDAIFLGKISVDKIKSHILTMDVSTRYGFTDNLEAELTVPFLYRSSNFQSAGVGGASNVISDFTIDDANIGDVSGSLFYRLKRETLTWPDIVLNVGFRAPTGTEPYGINVVNVSDLGDSDLNTNLNVPVELPTGNGVWGVTAGLSFLKTFDPAIVFANLGYTYNIDGDFDDISANAGNQPGSVSLGDSVYYGFGTAFALNERFSLSLSFAQQFTFESEIQQDGSQEQKVVGSNANVATFNVGATFALSDDMSFVSNVGLGLTPDASDVTVTFRLPFQI